MNTLEKISNKEAVVGVVGLGYVGLPLILGYVAKGFQCLGFDVDDSKITSLKSGKSYIKHIDGNAVKEAAESGLLDATADFSQASRCDALILCVPTPLDCHFEPDLSYVTNTLDEIAPHLREGQILSLESTTYPGTTEEEVVTRVEKRGLVPGESIFVVYSPEREDPGNPKFSATNIPKVVGGHTPGCLEAGVALYEAAFEQIVPVSSTKVAELTKLLENIYRSVNIGLINELKMAADKMGINIWEAIDAAATKPFGFTPFYPGPGLGGHCIPIDPFYLTWKAREYGIHTQFIELAGEVNRSMPEYVVSRTMEALNTRKKSVKGSRVLLLGLAYKPNVDDMRESPTFILMDRFAELGAEVNYYDPHVPEIGKTREHMEWAGKKSLEWSEDNLGKQDIVVIATNHSAVDYNELVEQSDLIVDTRNALRDSPFRSGQVFRA